MANKLKRYSFVLYMLIDAILISACYMFAVLLFYRNFNALEIDNLYSLLFYIAIHITLCQLGSQYNHIWQFATIRDFAKLFLFAILTGIVFIVINTTVVTSVNDIPISIFAVFSAINCILLSRLIFKYTFVKRDGTKVNAKKVKLAMIGAGSTCSTLLSNMENAKDVYYDPVCIFDDDDLKIGKAINGVRVVGKVEQAVDYCKQHGIRDILIAIPSATDSQRQRILKMLTNDSFKLRMIPSVEDIINNRSENYWSSVREVRVEDLLGRDPIKIDTPEVKSYIENKVVLVTGGGGSIGSELSRQIAAAKPKKLIILDIYENNAYEIQQELVRKYGSNLDLNVEIASVRDAKKVEFIFNKYKPQIVYHAAAHKHVPLMETNPEEAIKNNIFGTYNVAIAADKFGCEKFVLISSDKAVNPTNAMGATKRFCEMIVQSMKDISKTEYVAVRFGNVLGSNGSVVPLFKKQIAGGGPVTVTHKDIIRYFMTIPEAVQLVLITASKAESSNVYVLDMGEPVRIDDFARRMIILSGFVPDVDIKIEYTGLRPGEKLYEELLIDNETSIKTAHNKIFVEALPAIKSQTVVNNMKKLSEAIEDNDRLKAIACLSDVVSTYTPKLSENKSSKVRVVRDEAVSLNGFSAVAYDSQQA